MAYGPRVTVQVTMPERGCAAGVTITAGGTRHDYDLEAAPTADTVAAGTHAIAARVTGAERDELVAVLRLIEGGGATAGALV